MVSEDCTHVKSRLNYIDCHRHIIWILPCSSIVDRGHFRHAVHIDFMIENITQHCTCCNAYCALDNITCFLATAWKYMWSARIFSTCYKYKYVLQTCNMYICHGRMPWYTPTFTPIVSETKTSIPKQGLVWNDTPQIITYELTHSIGQNFRLSGQAMPGKMDLGIASCVPLSYVSTTFHNHMVITSLKTAII